MVLTGGCSAFPQSRLRCAFEVSFLEFVPEIIWWAQLREPNKKRRGVGNRLEGPPHPELQRIPGPTMMNILRTCSSCSSRFGKQACALLLHHFLTGPLALAHRLFATPLPLGRPSFGTLRPWHTVPVECYASTTACFVHLTPCMSLQHYLCVQNTMPLECYTLIGPLCLQNFMLTSLQN